MTVRLQRKSGFDERKAPKAPRPRHGDRGPGCPGGPGGPGVSTPFWVTELCRAPALRRSDPDLPGRAKQKQKLSEQKQRRTPTGTL